MARLMYVCSAYIILHWDSRALGRGPGPHLPTFSQRRHLCTGVNWRLCVRHLYCTYAAYIICCKHHHGSGRRLHLAPHRSLHLRRTSYTSVPEKKTTKKIWTWAGKHVCCFGSQLWLQMIYAHNFSRSSSYYV